MAQYFAFARIHGREGTGISFFLKLPVSFADEKICESLIILHLFITYSLHTWLRNQQTKPDRYTKQYPLLIRRLFDVCVVMHAHIQSRS